MKHEDCYAPCPNYPGQWFDKGTGFCSCGASHRRSWREFLAHTTELSVDDAEDTVSQAGQR